MPQRMPQKLRIHIIQHVDFEGPERIEEWIIKKNHSLTFSRLYQGDALPAQSEFDWLVVMGGPMGVNDIRDYSWLMTERHFILKSINSGKCILGVCLGAQLIAAALGANVVQGAHKEIGWFEIMRDVAVTTTLLKDDWPESTQAFHWHGDTFDLPAGSLRLASSEACVNQGFILNDRVIGLQFHLEVTPASVSTLTEKCGHELDNSKYVQTSAELMTNQSEFNSMNQLLTKILLKMEKVCLQDVNYSASSQNES